MKKQLLFILAALMLSYSASAQMVIEFNTNLSDGTTITLPLFGTVDVTVDWGDTNSDTYITVGNQEHTYAVEGIYTVSISGSLTQFGKGQSLTPNIDKLVKVTSFGDIGLTSLYGAFNLAANLIELPTVLPSTVENLNSMLRGASNFNFDIGGWDVSNVTNMGHMFSSAIVFDQDISTWNVGKVTDMESMFYQCLVFNQDIGGWNVSSVKNMGSMFNKARAFNQNIGGWNVSSVTQMGYMFASALVFDQDISGWDVSKVSSMMSMFSLNKVFNQDISGWEVSNVSNMKWMFQNATAFDQNIGSWNLRKVSDMTDMFIGVTLSTANYDNLLIGWAAQTLKSTVVFNGGNSKYSSGAAAAARAVLTGTYGWTITDGGQEIPSAVTSTDVNNLSIYPNPTNGIVHLDLVGKRIQNLKIVDVTGKIIAENNRVNPTETIDLSNFANGLYLIILQTENGTQPFKLIKE